MSLINVDEVENLEDYMLYLATFNLSIKSLMNLIQISTQRGILDADECEMGQTILHECRRLLITMEDQASSIRERIPLTKEELNHKLIALIKSKMGQK
jgi:hypothetical protein